MFGVYQTSSLVLLRDENYVNNVEQWSSKLKSFLDKEIKKPYEFGVKRLQITISSCRTKCYIR